MFSRDYLNLTESIEPFFRESLTGWESPAPPKRAREDLVVSLWMEQPWGAHPIRDVRGKRVEILSPGWLKRGPGPDFRNAVFRYDGAGPVKGDVEIHVRSSDWIGHKHHRDPNFNNTRLHVVLYCDSIRDPRMTQAGGALIEIELCSVCAVHVDKARSETESNPDSPGMVAVTGLCARRFGELGTDKAGELLDAAGEGRAMLKAKRFEKDIAAGGAEEALYRGIAETLGYSVYKTQFRRLAEAATLELLREITGGMDAQRRPIVTQGVLFGLAGLLPEKPSITEQKEKDAAELVSRLWEAWGEVNKRGKLDPVCAADEWPLKGTRPANYPMGRLAGFCHFLAKNMEGDIAGLFAAALETFPVNGETKERKAWLTRTASIFPSPVEDYWTRHYILGGKELSRPRRLVSEDRVSLMFVNVVIPFFLARAGSGNGKEEERLRRIFHAMPAPPVNSIVKFMTNAMFDGARPPRGFMNAAREQGLIQIYTDFCSASPQGCMSCRFAKYLERLE